MIQQQNLAELIDAIRQRLLAHFAPEKIILFGSYAHGAPTPDSDLDLLLVMDTEVPVWERYQLARQAIGAVGTPVDIFVLTPEEFAETKDVVGSLAYAPAKYGQVINEKP